jgi:hypothetical protein
VQPSIVAGMERLVGAVRALGDWPGVSG